MAKQKLKKIGEVVPRAFDKFLVISLDIEWLNYYGRLKFDVFLDKNNDLILKARPILGKRKRSDLFHIEVGKTNAN